jgi:hypothetical protein
MACRWRFIRTVTGFSGLTRRIPPSRAQFAQSGDGKTEFGRVAARLGIEAIHASTPQAKGRVERANQTLQDRLVKEMRLQNILSIEDANAYLPEFIERWNNRFGVKPRNETSAHRPWLDAARQDGWDHVPSPLFIEPTHDPERPRNGLPPTVSAAKSAQRNGFRRARTQAF